jgi:hypothetical protein
MKMRTLLCCLALFAGSAIGDTTVIIDGRVIHVPSNNVTVINGRVIVGGSDVAGGVLEGSGNIISERRDLRAFHTVRVSIPAAVTIRSGESSRCIVSADDNILPAISTTTHGQVLDIGSKRNHVSAHPIQIEIETPAVRRVALNSSGRIELPDIVADSLTLVIRGSGTVAAAGEVKNLVVSLNGSGNLRASELIADHVDVTINGSGTAMVNANAAIAAAINGSGSIVYRGNPSERHTSVSGSGSVRQR